MFDKQRLPWRLIESGPGSGIFRTTDGGDTWQRLGGGLPTRTARPHRSRHLSKESAHSVRARRESESAAGAAAGSSAIRVYRTDDGGTNWRRMSDTNVAGGKSPYAFNQIRVDPSNDKRVIVNSDNMTVSEDGGKTWDDRKVWPTGFFRRVVRRFPHDVVRSRRPATHPPRQRRRHCRSRIDGGHTSDFFPNLRVGEAYAVGVDMDDPYHVYAGFQDHDSWKGPVNGRWGSIMLEDWVTVGPGDGMYNVVDPTDSRWVYNTRELNQLGRMDQQTGIRKDIRPPQPPGVDSAALQLDRADRALAVRSEDAVRRRADALPLDAIAATRGRRSAPISRRTTATKIGFPSTPYCTISTFAESPVTAGVIWVGTDDGKVQLTRDAGAQWTDLTPALEAAGAPRDRWVSRVFPSPHDANVAFVVEERLSERRLHAVSLSRRSTAERRGRRSAAIFRARRSTSSSRIASNSHLLIVGNDIGVFVSIDDGAHWTRWKANLPTVPVHDLLDPSARERSRARDVWPRAVGREHASRCAS